MGGWTNNQAETITGLALTYLTTTVLFSTGSSFTLNADATFSSATDLNLTSGAGIVFDGDTRLSRDADGALQIDGKSILVGNLQNANALAGALTTTSAAYADVVGTVVNFTKRAAHTALRIDFSAGCFVTGAAATVRFAAAVTGYGDNDIGQLPLSTVNVHQQVCGTTIAADLAPPGAYTIQLRWLRLSGAGTITQTAFDVNTLTVSEC